MAPNLNQKGGGSESFCELSLTCIAHGDCRRGCARDQVVVVVVVSWLPVALVVAVL